MRPADRLHPFVRPLTIGRAQLGVAGLRRGGSGLPIVFLHGFGSTKEDYADVVHQPRLADHAILAFDAPGCGATTVNELDAASIPLLVSVTERMLAAEGIERFHLVGHSMGGLAALLVASAAPDRIATFTNIEGNLAPEDCFLSRQIVTHGHGDDEAFLAEFAERVGSSRYAASRLYAASLNHTVRAGAVRGIFESMVELSDHGRLLDRFLALPVPRLFMHGEQNASLSYLRTLAGHGVEIARISRSAHFPMYSNPVEMWDRISDFVVRSTREVPGSSSVRMR